MRCLHAAWYKIALPTRRMVQQCADVQMGHVIVVYRSFVVNRGTPTFVQGVVQTTQNCTDNTWASVTKARGQEEASLSFIFRAREEGNRSFRTLGLLL